MQVSSTPGRPGVLLSFNPLMAHRTSWNDGEASRDAKELRELLDRKSWQLALNG